MTRAVLLILLACAPIAGAHDFWIEPSTFRPAAPSTVTASLRVGENFEGDAVPRRGPRIESFVVRDSDGERPVMGFEGRDPAGVIRIESDRIGRNGVMVIGYRGKPHPHEISRLKFEQFLREEGIEGVRPRGNRIQRERFQRFAKSVLGGSSAAEPLGWEFELVVDGNVVRVLYGQKPLANAYVAALSRDGRRLSARTDREGRASLDLAKGVWLIKSVHVLPAPNGADYDWHSLWGSVTLER